MNLGLTDDHDLHHETAENWGHGHYKRFKIGSEGEIEQLIWDRSSKSRNKGSLNVI